MEIRQLACFAAVAEELSFARAAQRLHIVQPAVSQQVRRLERELGVRLFERTSRRVQLTAAGERLLPEARSVLSAAGRTRQVAAEIAVGDAGILRLGTSQGLGGRLDEILSELARRAPGVRVRLVAATAGERLEQVRSGRLDAAFVRNARAVAGVELLPMWDEPLAVALPAAHPLTAEPAVTLPQLRDLPLRIVPRQDNAGFRDLIERACIDAGFDPLPGPAFTNPQDTLAEIGTGPPSWTVLYESAAAQLTVRRVAFRPLDGLTAHTHLAVPPGPPSSTLRLLLRACPTAS
ncbi:LysR family transcriptional regulator [Trebonia kvetii]|uniref:LysR family transcriptional regulator n=1 Tax=Trebonia kvetii TaxID=2480626 RepID=A0A6P2BRB4_9ACTN|nr:LysR family transcriptional regulator [Trebonia kvetii]TVZ01572.1 LysR family transcriptional regulator [Trebonia kvetii]